MIASMNLVDAVPCGLKIFVLDESITSYPIWTRFVGSIFQENIRQEQFRPWNDLYQLVGTVLFVREAGRKSANRCTTRVCNYCGGAESLSGKREKDTWLKHIKIKNTKSQ